MGVLLIGSILLSSTFAYRKHVTHPLNSTVWRACALLSPEPHIVILQM